MPTGYTADVGDGKITELRDFALRCARAFGALILMRDDPMSAPIPDRIEPTSYYRDEAEKAEIEIARLQSLTTADVAAECRDDVARVKREQQEGRERALATVDRYRSMLAQVEEWKPPTEDHANLKTFMVQQLTESIERDGPSDFKYWPVPPSNPDEWRMSKVAELIRRRADYRAEAVKEAERAESRTAWIKALRESLPSRPLAATAREGG